VGREIAREPLLAEEGYIALPTTPGLGIELDEEALARRPYRAFGKRDLRQARDEGP
jgi:galactonate dehydratase